MIQETIQLRSNWYPDGPYLDSPCVHCRRLLKWTGAHGGVTWTPVQIDKSLSSDWSTCWENEVSRSAYGGHEPWEAIPSKAHEEAK